MWTYLTIFFSLALFLGVFIRKAILLYRKKGDDEAAVKAQEEKDLKESENVEEKPKKVKLGREEKGQVEGLYTRGETFLKAGKDEDAIKCFVQALAINPDHLETQQRLAMLYLQKQMYGAAAALFQKLADLTEDAVHYSHWGLALYQQSSFDQAKKAYQKAIMLDCSRPQRFVSLAQVYRSLGQGYHALIALNKALELDDKKVDFLYLIADLHLELGNLDMAEDMLRRIFELEPKNQEAKALMKETERIRKEKAEAQKN